MFCNILLPAWQKPTPPTKEYEMAFDVSKYQAKGPKPMPVFLLLDVSGSMSGYKIDSLNQAVYEMLRAFAKEEADIRVSIITFGASVDLLMENIPAKEASQKWQNRDAGGMTPMGMALRMAKDMIEDKNIVPSRSFRPLAVLVSDGAPNDAWEEPLRAFIHDGRSQKCDRMAMAIEANEKVLEQFIEGGTQKEVFHAEDASDIARFFQFVTMSVTSVAGTGATKPTGGKPETEESTKNEETPRRREVSNEDLF